MSFPRVPVTYAISAQDRTHGGSMSNTLFAFNRSWSDFSDVFGSLSAALFLF